MSKNCVTSKREDELWHQIKNNSPQDKLKRFAEKVRKAQLNYIKAQKHCIQVFRAEDDTPKKKAERKNLDEQKLIWESLSIEEIIEKYNEYGI